LVIFAVPVSVLLLARVIRLPCLYLSYRLIPVNSCRLIFRKIFWRRELPGKKGANHPGILDSCRGFLGHWIILLASTK
jgi:hypothetical protein